MHANCHRVDVAIKVALGSGLCLLVDTVATRMQEAALFWKKSPACLPVLRTVAATLQTSAVKPGVLHEHRWVAFAVDALRRMLWAYALPHCGLG